MNTICAKAFPFRMAALCMSICRSVWRVFVLVINIRNGPCNTKSGRNVVSNNVSVRNILHFSKICPPFLVFQLKDFLWDMELTEILISMDLSSFIGSSYRLSQGSHPISGHMCPNQVHHESGKSPSINSFARSSAWQGLQQFESWNVIWHKASCYVDRKTIVLQECFCKIMDLNLYVDISSIVYTAKKINCIEGMTTCLYCQVWKSLLCTWLAPWNSQHQIWA